MHYRKLSLPAHNIKHRKKMGEAKVQFSRNANSNLPQICLQRFNEPGSLTLKKSSKDTPVETVYFTLVFDNLSNGSLSVTT